MNIDRFSPLFQRTTLLFSLFAGSLLLTACGGGSDNKSSASSSSRLLSSSARSSYTAASVPANGSGIWPSVKVEAQTPKQLTFQWSVVDGATHYKLFKHDVASGGITQVGGDLTATQASDDIGVHVHDWVNNYYYVEACNADSCQKSDLTFTATEMIKAIGYLKGSNTQFFDNFGWSIAISADGNTLAVGAPAEDSKAIGINGDQTNNESRDSGAVYVFVKENGIWVQEAYLKASNTEQPNLNEKRFLINDRFGYRVALSDDGNTLAVSSLLEDAISRGVNCSQENYERRTINSSDPSADTYEASDNNSGAVYVFTRANKTWTQDAFIKSIYFAEGMGYGETLALSGDGKTLAVGTTQDAIPAAGIIKYQASSMPECIEYYPSSTSASSNSSSSSSATTASSSSTNSFNGGPNSGAVQILIRLESGWMHQAIIKHSNAQQADNFATSIALSTDGNVLVAGATGEDSDAKGANGNQSNNTCYYFKDPDYIIDSGCAEAGKYLIRGPIDNGAAYVFKRVDGTWEQEAYLKPGTTFIRTGFGTSVDISGDGNTIAVGAPGDASSATTINGDTTQRMDYANTGAAYIFSRSGGNWQQEAVIKPSTITRHSGVGLVNNNNQTYSIQINDGGQFGSEVSLSQDGNTLAAGSFRERSHAKGINGDEGDTSLERAGAAFVFTRTNAVWTQKSYVKASNTDKDDRFGLNLDLSGDGKTMVVGAHRESGRGYMSATSTSSSSASSLPAGVLDQNDNSQEASGAVYVY